MQRPEPVTYQLRPFLPEFCIRFTSPAHEAVAAFTKTKLLVKFMCITGGQNTQLAVIARIFDNRLNQEFSESAAAVSRIDDNVANVIGGCVVSNNTSKAYLDTVQKGAIANGVFD